jgi:hypothetical protein
LESIKIRVFLASHGKILFSPKRWEAGASKKIHCFAKALVVKCIWILVEGKCLWLKTIWKNYIAPKSTKEWIRSCRKYFHIAFII